MTALQLLTGTGTGADEDGVAVGPTACFPDLEHELGQKMLADLFESVLGAVLTGIYSVDFDLQLASRY